MNDERQLPRAARIFISFAALLRANGFAVAPEQTTSFLAAIELLETKLRDLGVSVATPFMYLSFLALSVIPELRVTDQGIVDVRSFELVPLGISLM